jgi:hypothetical protein
LSEFSSASRPFASRSSFCSREKNWRILLRARDEATSDSQSRDGPARGDLPVRISTRSPLRSR